MVVNHYSWILSILKNSYTRGLSVIEVRLYSNSVLQILQIFVNIGYIAHFTLLPEKKILIFLRYVNLRPTWSSMIICNKPSSDMTVSLRTIRNNMRYDRGSVYIISTSKGLLTGLECLKHKTGGKLVCVLV